MGRVLNPPENPERYRDLVVPQGIDPRFPAHQAGALPLDDRTVLPSRRGAVTNERAAALDPSPPVLGNGRDGRVRTDDLLSPRQARYQAAPHPVILSEEKAGPIRPHLLTLASASTRE